ncbi:hypothetical protein HWV62_1977 [Athelia sp. TMB]|nr:hypothetical protein HWV62_1977 [Athelia sp. TMB]
MPNEIGKIFDFEQMAAIMSRPQVKYLDENGKEAILKLGSYLGIQSYGTYDLGLEGVPDGVTVGRLIDCAFVG